MSSERSNDVPRGKISPHSQIFETLLAVKAIKSNYKNVLTAKQTTINFCGLGRTNQVKSLDDLTKDEIRAGWKLHIQSGCQSILLAEASDMQKTFSSLGEEPGPRATTAEKHKRVLEELYHNAATKFVLNMVKLGEFDHITASTAAPPLSSDPATYRLAVQVCAVGVEVLNEVPMINMDHALLQRNFVACLSTQRRNNTRSRYVHIVSIFTHNLTIFTRFLTIFTRV